MNRTLWLLILANVLMTSFAQLALKTGMTNPVMQRSVVEGFRWPLLADLGSNPYVLLGLSLYFASALIWLLVLARIDLSLAYPFVAIGFVVTMLLAAFVLGETINVMRVAGTMLIASGVAILARS